MMMQHLMLAAAILMTCGGLQAAEPAKSADGVESIGADPRVRREVVRWMEDLHGSAAGAKDFVLEQAPLVLREMVALGRVEQTTYLACWCALMLAGAVILRRLMKARWCDWTDPGGIGAATAFSHLGAVGLMWAGIIGAAWTFHWFASAWFAPRLYVVETLARLIGVAHGR
jgi:hypothetical protein